MSRSRSSSIGNMPPRHGKKLVDVMDEVFKKSNRDEGEEEKSEHDGPNEAPVEDAPEKEPVIQQPDGYTMSSVYPPQPCERCVRAKKACKGIAGARCEHCKTLHQKCSNSTGPPRGRHAAGRPYSIAPKSDFENGTPASSTGQVRPKRRAATKKKLLEADEDDFDEYDDDERTAQTHKKRRVANDGSQRARLMKDMNELEGTIKRFQSTFAKELARLQQIAGSLASEIRDMDED